MRNVLAGIDIMQDALKHVKTITITECSEKRILVTCGTEKNALTVITDEINDNDREEWIAQISHAVKELLDIHVGLPLSMPEKSDTVKKLESAILHILESYTVNPIVPKMNSAEMYARLADATAPGSILAGGGNISNIQQEETVVNGKT
jgi:hypothetical protein